MRRVTLEMKDKTLATDLLRALHRLSDETIRADVRIRTDHVFPICVKNWGR